MTFFEQIFNQVRGPNAMILLVIVVAVVFWMLTQTKHKR